MEKALESLSKQDHWNCTEDFDINDALGPKKYVARALIGLSTVALALNLSVMVVLLRYNNKKLNSHDMLVFNQCLSDCLICLFTIIDRALTYSPDFLSNESYLCVMMVTAMVRFLSFVVTLLNMIAITVSRLIAVYKPTSYNVVFSRRTTIAMIAAMFAAVVLLAALQCGLLAVRYVRRAPDARTTSFCLTFYLPGGSDAIDASLTSLFALLIVLMPLVYSYIVVTVRKRKAKAKAGTSSAPDAANRAGNVMVTSFWIVATFLLCFTPYAFVRIAMRFSPQRDDCSWQKWMNEIACYLGAVAMLNCFFDPIIYALRIPKIREGYTQVWTALKAKLCTSR